MTENELEDIIGKLFHDIFVVEAVIAHRRGGVKVYLVIEKKGGITVDDLTMVQQILRPRLDIEFGRERLSLEVSSPGLNRKIKNNREYGFFTGRTVQILIEKDWIMGILKDVNPDSITLETQRGNKVIPLATIRKGRLKF